MCVINVLEINACMQKPSLSKYQMQLYFWNMKYSQSCCHSNTRKRQFFGNHIVTENLDVTFDALSHMCHESGLLIGSQQVSFFRTNLLFPNLPAFLFIDKTGFLIGYKNPNLPACCLRCRPPQTAQQQ